MFFLKNLNLEPDSWFHLAVEPELKSKMFKNKSGKKDENRGLIEV
jgi:hypothetical protein